MFHLLSLDTIMCRSSKSLSKKDILRLQTLQNSIVRCNYLTPRKSSQSITHPKRTILQYLLAYASRISYINLSRSPIILPNTTLWLSIWYPINSINSNSTIYIHINKHKLKNIPRDQLQIETNTDKYRHFTISPPTAWNTLPIDLLLMHIYTPPIYKTPIFDCSYTEPLYICTTDW